MLNLFCVNIGIGITQSSKLVKYFENVALSIEKVNTQNNSSFYY